MKNRRVVIGIVYSTKPKRDQCSVNPSDRIGQKLSP
jgi:hypothetical protein